MTDLKIITLIPVWKRPEVFLQTYKKAINPIFVLSPEDENIEIFENLIEPERIVYAYNYFLGEKHNIGIDYIQEQYDYDYLMNLGSDDIVLFDELIELYRSLIENNIKIMGLNSCYVYNSEDSKNYFIKNNNPNRAIGAGRLIHKSLIDEMYSKNIKVYEPKLNRGLDGNSADRIMKYCRYRTRIVNTENPPVVDIKSDVNINMVKKLHPFMTEVNIDLKNKFDFSL